MPKRNVISDADSRNIKPLDIVITPKGAYAYVTEINISHNSEYPKVSIDYFGNYVDGNSMYGEYNAWWNAKDLVIIDNFASIFARSMCHPFGSGETPALKAYPRPNIKRTDKERD